MKTKWTRELPTDPGVYWWTYDKKEKPIPVIIYESESGYIFATDTKGKRPLNTFPSGWWTTKPVLPPEAVQ